MDLEKKMMFPWEHSTKKQSQQSITTIRLFPLAMKMSNICASPFLIF